ncbi:lanthionine synthetase C family protein [Streptomyces sp. IMTB 2501]|uniref:lanthionine synthetase C family protein n=1 Tax=Streptomyces sp. IMTB 2501 TaxID=1776340 RepID=UPI0015BB1A8F|nr:lanthionine synthetase C family protein [Streptomyces sp. IMTB 2501]
MADNAPPDGDAVAGDAVTRGRAQRIVAELAERLNRQDQTVVTATTGVDTAKSPSTGTPQPPVSGPTLAAGHSGVALLYGELSHAAPALRITAHAHLATALSTLGSQPGVGLYDGATSLAFAARVTRHRPQDYATILNQLDERITAGLRTILDAESARLDAGHAGVAMRTYDTISGVTGIGRYLLLRGDGDPEALTESLSYLVRLVRPVRAHGFDVPGWWVPTGPSLQPDIRFPRGHLNLGAAHGICGPLALLSLAHESGVRVPGQSEAIHVMVEHVLSLRLDGGRWPRVVGFDDFVAGSPGTDSEARLTAAGWCYGTPGVARALYLAGRALDQPEWRDTATQSLTGTLLSLTPHQVGNGSLCHGWAGLLQIAWRMADDSADAGLARLLPGLARRLIDAYDPGLPYGFSHDRPALMTGQPVPPHRPGFLEGAAGIALALHTYATGRNPSSPWDAALMLD